MRIIGYEENSEARQAEEANLLPCLREALPKSPRRQEPLQMSVVTYWTVASLVMLILSAVTGDNGKAPANGAQLGYSLLSILFALLAAVIWLGNKIK